MHQYYVRKGAIKKYMRVKILLFLVSFFYFTPSYLLFRPYRLILNPKLSNFHFENFGSYIQKNLF